MRDEVRGTVLLLEDDTQFAWELSQSLAEDGFEVIRARSATEALDLLSDTKFDVVLADIFIRQKGDLLRDGGVRLISQIKQIKNEDTPIVAISGAFSRTERNQIELSAKVVGARVTLAKPFHHEELLNILYELLKR